MKVEVWADGASKGNPGPSGIGAMVDEEAYSEYIGRATNNQAEYRAVILGLEKAKEMGATEVVLRSDSNLVIRQLSGDWQVNENVELYERAKELLEEFDDVDIAHVSREKNEEADSLATWAIEAAGKT